ncbi:Radial spoke head protein 4 A [Boothiomyces macroporosus]|uniref:Radial spoke head protein 4 A n=1 Tax=Boothiomyces macroporosus TaxID=261099 RepID=A0AAD5UKT0_9FUNG|nr:Radial spoke head protein 4 A [Boothiomyces macroporosus]
MAEGEQQAGGGAKPQTTLFSDDNEFWQAKNFLNTKMGVKAPINLYDHLTNVIMHAMETKATNVVDNFEQLSLDVKKQLFTLDESLPTSIKVSGEKHLEYESVKQKISFYKKPAEDATDGDTGDFPDMMDLAGLWEWAGVSFGKEDTFLLFLAIKNLVEVKQLKSVRLWGKIFGTQGNYIIVEAELKEGAADEEDAIVNAEEVFEKEVPAVTAKDEDDGVAVPKVKQMAPLGKEVRIGVNKYIYYVCSHIGGPWTRLPDVVPERLQESRKIHKYFTGDLKHKIESYPEFKGNEAQYLRCQIARISAATVVSPKGYYIIDPEAEDVEENNGNPPIIINPEYEGLTNEQLTSPGNWVHHVPYILPQGRCVWEAPKAIKEEVEGEEKEEEEEEEQEDDANSAEPESGPSLLGVLTSDDDHGTIPAWSSRICSQLSPTKFSPVCLRSNNWPGASAMAYNDKFANIYVGDGLKDLGNPEQHFVPPALGPIQKEYTIPEGSENILTEQLDPTVEAEEAYEEEKRAKDDEGKEEEEGGEVEEAEEE